MLYQTDLYGNLMNAPPSLWVCPHRRRLPFTAVGSAERAGVFQGPAATATTPLAATDESRASPAVPADRSAACAAPAERQDAMPATAATVTPQRASRFAQLPAAEQMATYFQVADPSPTAAYLFAAAGGEAIFLRFLTVPFLETGWLAARFLSRHIRTGWLARNCGF